MPKLVGVIVDLESQETNEALFLVKENVLDVIQVHSFEAALKFCTDNRFENIPHYRKPYKIGYLNNDEK